MARKGRKQRSQIKNSRPASGSRSRSEKISGDLTVLPEKTEEIPDLISPISDSESESLSSEIHGSGGGDVFLEVKSDQHPVVDSIGNDKLELNCVRGEETVLSYIPPVVSNGEKTVRFKTSELQEESLKWRFAVVGCVLVGSPKFRQIENFATHRWKR